ncbi:DUF6134 family protein [Thalassospira sp. MCCC 1A01428]|uniref:DUF6134 family protein n=1 Tax=Thalassospira sp. MCCC 1A01428 TaxID=1470575 RepID=UPI001FEDDF19|nr:DUF6134 family protein [Thalassospira sp. MCCC 1A01428]
MKGRHNTSDPTALASPLVITIPMRFLIILLLAATIPGICFSTTAHAASSSPLPSATCTNIDPVKLYGSTEWVFQIRREGSPVGTHKLQFHTGKDGIQVIAQSTINISFLGFSAYRFDYRSESLWQHDRLAKLAVNVDDDGDQTSLNARYDSKTDMLQATGPDGERTLPAGIFPTNHWHCGVLSQTTVLNTITGQPNNVTIRSMGQEKIIAGNGGVNRIDATHFQYDGELRTDAWYDADGRWVRLAFRARDGSEIVYRCLTCTRNIKAAQ